MMKSKKKQDPLVRKDCRELNKKVIILLITMVISLSILLMPCLVSSSILYTPSIVSAKELAENRNSYIETIINGYVQELKDKGYVDVTWKISPIAEQVGVNFRTVPVKITGNLEEDMKQAVLKNYIFYANYSTLSEKEDTVYYFKTPQESDNFITEINKYEKTNFTKGAVRKIIGSETTQDILDNAIKSKKIIAEKREAARKAAAAKAAAAKKKKSSTSNKITDTKVVTDNAVVNYALQFKGNPYVYGGTSLTKGADCSGFTQSIYKHFGVKLPRTASAQAKAGKYVPWNELKAGDLVFYSGNGGKSVTHVAIYIGNSKIIHASTPKGGIKVSTVNIMVKMTARRVI